MKTKFGAGRASACAPEKYAEAFELAVSQEHGWVDIQMTVGSLSPYTLTETIDRVCDGSGCVW